METDGFGRSDTREGLRRSFEVDAEHVVFAALGELVRIGKFDRAVGAGDEGIADRRGQSAAAVALEQVLGIATSVRAATVMEWLPTVSRGS